MDIKPFEMSYQKETKNMVVYGSISAVPTLYVKKTDIGPEIPRTILVTIAEVPK